MSQDECPHCGEPVEEGATFCRHCGSDAETGWNPDAEYESIELPEDEPEEAPEATREEIKARLRELLGPAMVASAWVFFVIYGYSRLQPRLLVLIPAAYLALAAAIVLRMGQRAPSR